MQKPRLEMRAKWVFCHSPTAILGLQASWMLPRALRVSHAPLNSSNAALAHRPASGTPMRPLVTPDGVGEAPVATKRRKIETMYGLFTF